jgi:uncharacterized protein involved in exopolysaccharide biosynthesis
MMKSTSEQRTFPHAATQDDEIDLTKYLVVLWRHRFLLLAVTLLSGVVALAYSKIARPTYEATTALIVSFSKLGELSQPAVSMVMYKQIFDSQSLAQQVMQEFKLAEHPYDLTVDMFLRKAVSAEVIREANVILVRVRLPDPVLAARVANRLAQHAVEAARQLSQEETIYARDIIKQERDDSIERFRAAETRLKEFKTAAQIDLAKKDVEILLGQRGDYLKLVVEIEGEKARLKRAEEELARQEQFRSGRRAIESSTLRPGDRGPLQSQTMPPAKEDPGVSPEPRFRDEVLNPYVNPVYEMLDQQIATSRTRLAALERQRAELVGSLKLDRPQLDRLTQLYTGEIQLSRLETEYELARKVYVDVATRYEQTRLKVAERTAQLQILDHAIPRDRPVAPRPVRYTAIALVVGFLLAVVVVSLTDLIAAAVRQPSGDRTSEAVGTEG